MTIPEDRANRIEEKVDRLIEAVNKLAVIDERQVHAGIRTGQLEDKVSKLQQKVADLEKLVEKWINRGLGIWGLVLVLYALYQTFGDKLMRGP